MTHFKKAFCILSFFTLALSLASINGPQDLLAEAKAAKDGVFSIKPQDAAVEWIGRKKLGSQHNGTLQLTKGEVTVKNGKPQSGVFIFDMDSITVLDIKDKDSNAKLTGHLKSDDFFGVDKHKTAVFTISKITEKKSKKGTHRLEGSLKIKGKENPIQIPASLSIEDNKIQMRGGVDVDRTKYGIRYASENFFEDLVGDRIISDDFTVQFNLNLTSDAKTS